MNQEHFKTKLIDYPSGYFLKGLIAKKVKEQL